MIRQIQAVLFVFLLSHVDSAKATLVPQSVTKLTLNEALRSIPIYEEDLLGWR